jgi:hypothetical protein
MPAEATPHAPATTAELPSVVLPSIPAPAPRPIIPGELANEIRDRVAGFRAHQERFNREREQYFSATIARLRATLNQGAQPRSEE